MRLLGSELLKLRTTRTTYVLLGVSVLIAGIAAVGFVASGSLDDEPHRALTLGQGASFGTLFVVVIGILIVTNEYRHGTIMTTFLAEPRRPRVLLAKLATAVIAGIVFSAAALAVAFLIAVPWLSARGHSLPVDSELLETVGRSLLAFALTAVVGAAVGAVVQSQVGALVGYFVWIFVVESLVGVLSGLAFTEVGEPDPVSKFLPGSALGGIIGGEGNEYVLRGGWAALLATGYAVALSLLGAISMTRRDP